MSDQQLTDWFPGSVKPVRPGVYEVSGWGGNFSEWNGEAWGLRSSSPHKAADWGYFEGGFVKTSNPPQKWRGLASDPHSRTDDSQTDDHTGICLEVIA